MVAITKPARWEKLKFTDPKLKRLHKPEEFFIEPEDVKALADEAGVPPRKLDKRVIATVLVERSKKKGARLTHTVKPADRRLSEKALRVTLGHDESILHEFLYGHERFSMEFKNESEMRDHIAELKQEMESASAAKAWGIRDEITMFKSSLNLLANLKSILAAHDKAKERRHL